MLLRALLTGLLLLVVGSVIAQDEKNSTYAELLARVKKMDPDVDFAALRMAYAQTPDYNPYGNDRAIRNEMRGALQSKEFENAVKHADTLLNKNFVDIEAHRVAARAHSQLNDAERAKFHAYVQKGLLLSIVKSGDGKTAETAFVVIATSEEYLLMQTLRFRHEEQSLVEENGHAYDIQYGKDDEDQPFMLYFNIDRPFQWLGDTLKKKGGVF